MSDSKEPASVCVFDEALLTNELTPFVAFRLPFAVLSIV